MELCYYALEDRPSSPFHFRHWPRPRGLHQRYLRHCGLPNYGSVDSLTKGAGFRTCQESLPGQLRVLIPKRHLPGRERAPRRPSLAKPQQGSPEPSPPQPLSPARPGGHPRGRGSPARGRGRRAIGFCAALRGGTSAGRQTRAYSGRGGCRAQSSLALACPARRGRRNVSAGGSPARQLRAAGASMR